MRCIDDESWDALKRHTAEHLRSRVWLGGAYSVIPATAPVRRSAEEGRDAPAGIRVSQSVDQIR